MVLWLIGPGFLHVTERGNGDVPVLACDPSPSGMDRNASLIQPYDGAGERLKRSHRSYPNRMLTFSSVGRNVLERALCGLTQQTLRGITSM